MDLSPPAEDLSQILATNCVAYTELVDSYRATADARAADAPELLGPVLAAAREKGGPIVSALELGCADGVFTSWLAREGLTVTAVEYSEPMRDAARSRLRADKAPLNRVTILPHEFHNGDTILPPLRNKFFDVVIAMAFVHLFPAGVDLAVLRQVGRHLAPGGVAFLTTTVENEDRRGFDVKEGPHASRIRYRSRYTEATFIQLVETAGLEVKDKRCLMDPRVKGKTWLDLIVKHPSGSDLLQPPVDGGA